MTPGRTPARSFGRAVRPAPPPRSSRAPGLAMAAIVGGLILAGGALAALRRPAPPDPAPTLRLGTAVIVAPRAALLAPDAVGRREAERIDLAFRWPDLAPAGAEAPIANATLLRLGLTPADDAPDPAERPTALYGRFLSPVATPVEGGLIRREFRDDSPFAGEILLMAPPDGRVFAARCPMQEGPGAGSCFLIIRKGAVEAQAMFDRGLTARWPEVAQASRALLDRLAPDPVGVSPSGRSPGSPSGN